MAGGAAGNTAEWLKARVWESDLLCYLGVLTARQFLYL